MTAGQFAGADLFYHVGQITQNLLFVGWWQIAGLNPGNQHLVDPLFGQGGLVLKHKEAGDRTNRDHGRQGQDGNDQGMLARGMVLVFFLRFRQQAWGCYRQGTSYSSSR